MILELNYVLDRNTFVANMMATELADQLPTRIGHEMQIILPHTRASFKIQVKLKFTKTQILKAEFA